MARFLLTFLFIVSTCYPVFTMAAGKSNTSKIHTIPAQQQYIDAKRYLNKLKKGNEKAFSRDDWLEGTRNFRRLYLVSPKGQYAPNSLFLLGYMYGEMFKRFSNRLDFDESISYYHDVTTRFPKSVLSDDSYYAQADLYLKDKNYAKAKDYYKLILAKYPKGDMAPKAKKKLNASKPMPDINIQTNLHIVEKLPAKSAKTIHPVKFWASDDYCRISIMADGPVEYDGNLEQDAEQLNNILNIIFENSYIDPTLDRNVLVKKGLLKSVRSHQLKDNKVKISLNLDSISNYKIFTLPDPFRVIIDVRGKDVVSKGKKQASLIPVATPPKKKTPKQPKKKVVKKEKIKKPEVSSGVMLIRSEELKKITIPSNYSHKLTLAQQLGLGIRNIVIDPGHGGKDPGAISGDVKEKDVVLNIARKLAPLLADRLQCKVTLTRNNDTFIPLEQRTAIANTNNADLFISLHVNAHRQTDIHGLETYFLNLSTTPEAMRVAARENAVSSKQMSDLQDILSSIMNNSKINESERLAANIHTALMRETKSSNSFNSMHDLGVKQAPFYVLIGAEMPSVLIEVGFITNKNDRKNLTNSKFISTIAKQIVAGVTSYSKSNKQ